MLQITVMTGAMKNAKFENSWVNFIMCANTRSRESDMHVTLYTSKQIKGDPKFQC